MRKQNENQTTNNWAEMLLQPFSIDERINTLDSLQVDDILEARELAEQLLKMKKLGTLKKELDINYMDLGEYYFHDDKIDENYDNKLLNDSVEPDYRLES